MNTKRTVDRNWPWNRQCSQLCCTQSPENMKKCSTPNHASMFYQNVVGPALQPLSQPDSPHAPQLSLQPEVQPLAAIPAPVQPGLQTALQPAVEQLRAKLRHEASCSTTLMCRQRWIVRSQPCADKKKRKTKRTASQQT